jgi:hypothetical protein
MFYQPLSWHAKDRRRRAPPESRWPRGSAADLTRNIEDEVAVGGFIGVPPGETVVQIRKLKRIAAERGYPLIPGHDPVAWPALTRELAARWPAGS